MGGEKVFRDPLYGYIDVTKEELDIIELPIFQRLRWITQLSFVEVAYPGAKHSRFEHALGVMHLCGLFGDHLKGLRVITEDDARLLRLAGLLHDIGHGPFSHAFEPTLAYQIRQDSKGWRDVHVRWGEEILLNPAFGLTTILSGNELKDIGLLINKQYTAKPVLQEVLTGPFSADRLDYLRRDAYHAGTPEYAIIDAERIIRSIFVFDNQVGYLAKAQYALEGAILSYFFMYRALYFHHAARAAYLLFDKACWQAFGKGQLAVDLNTADAWFSLTDKTIFALIAGPENQDVESKNFIHALKRRDLPKRVLDESDFQLRASLLKNLDQAIQESYAVKHEMEELLKQDLDYNVYIDTPTLVPYPRPADDPVIIPDKNKPHENYRLSSSSSVLVGLRGQIEYIMPRVYVEPTVRRGLKSAKLQRLQQDLSESLTKALNQINRR